MAISARRLAIAAANLVDSVQGASYANLGTAGTVVAVPARTWGVQIVGTADSLFQVGTALGTVAARVPANDNPTFALPSGGSVALAAASGSANFALNFLKLTDGA